MKNLPLQVKLILAFLAVGVLPLLVVSVILIYNASDALSDAAENQLISIREIKKSQIDRYFTERQGDMNVLLETVATLQEDAFEKLEAVQDLKVNDL